MHEYIHYGTVHNNISEGSYEFGWGFEKDVFNIIGEDVNAIQTAIIFAQYF
ncbi:MAG: hypothetical protein H7Y86_11430 [Rhizobacter sp.]|nr:hypothetical protein [Ferruginibacter sp.]